MALSCMATNTHFGVVFRRQRSHGDRSHVAKAYATTQVGGTHSQLAARRRDALSSCNRKHNFSCTCAYVGPRHRARHADRALSSTEIRAALASKSVDASYTRGPANIRRATLLPFFNNLNTGTPLALPALPALRRTQPSGFATHGQAGKAP